ncbi:hypothetical protein E4U55_000045 [Claviceps digitariae]|nr:hypothetical protein E4U55_000045 [Claviceps digitariae]
MPRFSVAFTKRKSASEGLDNVTLPSTDSPSFRVIDRAELANERSFDGGARLQRASKSFPLKPNLLDLGAEENMFADLKVNRASNISNTTKGTSTDNSSRHSNASTAPSSADMSGPHGHDDARPPPKMAPQESPSQSNSKSIGSGFLDRASRTFSFGGAKKQSISPPTVQDPVPDMPPLLSLGRETSGHATSRGMTASTESTVTPAEDQEGSALDLGGDFGSMFKNLDKRASTATLTLAGHDNAAPRSLTGNHYGTSGPISPDGNAPTEPLLSRGHSATSGGDSSSSPMSPRDDEPPLVPRHEHLHSFTYSSRPDDVVEDEDAKFLRESISAMRYLAESHDEPTHVSHIQPRHGQPTQTIASGFQNEDNMFEGSTSKMSRTRASQRYAPRSSNPSGNKVMTPAQFEKYRKDKETSGNTVQETRTNASKPAAQNHRDDDDDEDDINYDDDEDEQEKSKQQTRQRRKQEAHMAVYRQQMMKVTGETSSAVPVPTRQTPVRPNLPMSSTAPALGHFKTPSPDSAIANAASSEEDDEDVPLAILQAHGFPHKNRPPTRLGVSGSDPNLLASVTGLSLSRPASMVGSEAAAATNNGRRQSKLPAFARNLPQDPFVGASIARPAIRESLHFGDAKRQPSPQPPQQGPLPPGGLVGVIASEERSRAMRRGSPSVDPSKMMAGGLAGQDPFAAIPSHMMYNGGGLSGMPSMQQTPPPQPPMLTPGDQAQLQMNQQMHQFMQMQMQFMQMMAINQNGAPMAQQTAIQPPYGGGMTMMGNPSMGDVNRRSMMMDPMMESPPRQMDHHHHHQNQGHHARTMSMVQPSSSSFLAPLGQAIVSPMRGAGGAYTPSIAPSERSNVGLPGRYRPVTQACVPSSLSQHVRSNTISGDLSNWSDDKSKSTVKLLVNSGEGSDDDDEQGWEAMKTRRDKKRSLWRGKRTSADELNIAF